MLPQRRLISAILMLAGTAEAISGTREWDFSNCTCRASAATITKTMTFMETLSMLAGTTFAAMLPPVTVTVTTTACASPRTATTVLTLTYDDFQDASSGASAHGAAHGTITETLTSTSTTTSTVTLRAAHTVSPVTQSAPPGSHPAAAGPTPAGNPARFEGPTSPGGPTTTTTTTTRLTRPDGVRPPGGGAASATSPPNPADRTRTITRPAGQSSMPSSGSSAVSTIGAAQALNSTVPARWVRPRHPGWVTRGGFLPVGALGR